MLTRELGIVEYKKGVIHPDRLTRRSHGQYLDFAGQMLDVYRKGKGRTREELHRAVRNVFTEEPDCDPRRIRAFCKLLDDVSEYDTDRSGQSADIRKKVFRRAAPFHPLVRDRDKLFEHAESVVKQQIADDLNMSWQEIDDQLYADVMEFHRLRHFEGYPDAESLLSRYNVAQTQVALYSATRMTLKVTQDLKTIVRHIKLCRLLHRITRIPPQGTYRIDLDGPASILRETRRYGVNMARFLPALLACRGWQMEALIQTNRGGWKQWLRLSPKDGLKSHLPEPEEFDSSVEENFWRKWGDKPRDGWRLHREGDILHHGQKVFLPDFTFEHEDKGKVYLEIVGFWTPEYLKDKMEILKLFDQHRILVAVTESSADTCPDITPPPVRYKTALRIKDILDALNRFFR